MAIQLTARTLRALQEKNLKPNLIIQFDGLSTLFSTVPVQEIIRINDPGLFIDGTWFIGGLRPIEDNKVYIDSESTTFKTNQQMNYDEAKGSSISTMTIGLVDKNEEISQLISPGFDLEDVLGRKANVFVVYGTGSFFEDSILIFKGFVVTVDSGAGIIKFKLNHPDNKKKVELFKSVETGLTANINASQITVPVDSTANYILPLGALTTYIRIDNELIQYTGFDATNFTGLIRGSLGSIAVGHADNAQVRALFCLEGNPLDLALQLMMSGHGSDPVYEDVPVTSFVRVGSGTTDIANAVFFDGINIPQAFNIQPGDTATITGATNGANNITTAIVSSVTQFEGGYYIVFSGVSMVLELDSSAVIKFFTQYNTLPDGMRMKPDEVDINEHLRIRDFFHSATQMRLYIKQDEIEGKEYLDEQLYKPIACYSLSRKARSSVGYTIGPIPGQDIKTLDATTIREPKSFRILRSTNSAFFNEVVFKFDDTPLSSEEKFTRGDITISQTSKNRIPGTTKTYTAEAQGLRSDLNAVNIIATAAQRILDRYKFGAQKINPKTHMGTAASIEIGDIVVADLSGLKVTDITQGNRRFKGRFFEVQNKATNYKTGNVDIIALDTGLGLDSRFALISPCSPIASVLSSSVFIIGPDPVYPSKFGFDEFRKWEASIGLASSISVRIHNEDYSIDEDLVVTKIEGNQFTLQDPASITLAAGLIVEYTGYTDTDVTDKQKLIYGFMTDAANFPDGGNPYTMI